MPPRTHIRSAVPFLAAILVAGALLCGCASPDAAGDLATGPGDCPAEPVDLVVTVGQWNDLAVTIAGACAHVRTIVGGSAGDPHEFEPAVSDAAHLTRAGLVLVNGLGYDDWAVHVLGAMRHPPAVVDAAEAAGLHEGDNPHVWYGPGFVDRVADALSAELKAQLPAASAYLDGRRTEWSAASGPLHAAVATLSESARGRSYAATEPVFEYMAAAVGLVDRTPSGYRDAVANESDPSPGDLHALDAALRSGQIDVLVRNLQTESALDSRLLEAATAAGVPVVGVTETVPPGLGFVQWQVDQLDSLARALGSA